MKIENKQMKAHIRFIDLFAGIGGFHQALNNIGAKCVFASEINKDCQTIYKKNFPNTKLFGDIKKHIKDIPDFDFLCAGFPCQPFSKAGKQKGFKDKNSGTLFFTLMEILKQHNECKFILLENVKNLADNKENWKTIQSELKKLDFYVNKDPIILSPHQFGIPQIRERLFIVGIRTKNACQFIKNQKCINEFNLKFIKKENQTFNNDTIEKFLDKNVSLSFVISKREKQAILMWYKFKKMTNFESVGAPIWAEYFGYKLNDKEFLKFKDHNGVLFSNLPEWKKTFVLKNRKFYKKYKNIIDKWIKEYDVLNLPLIYQKFEWNCGGKEDIKNTIIQFRQSGIRVKRKNYFPTLVAINNTPIIFDKSLNEFRNITPRETANLQSFNKNYKIINENQFYKQIGNAVNVKIIENISKGIISLAN